MRLVSLESAFKKACDRHPNLKLLESQWRFDKELISKALQNIGTIFPHYSRHDSSHSKQIIVNIERLLGDRISNLTATDMWLILESAYTHDIGMVITNKQIQDMDTPEFSTFIKELVAQPEHVLHEFATNWANNKSILPTGAAAHDFFNKYIQLISEWYRGKHPDNSAKIVKNPYIEIGLDSPRNELLPKRLFGTLASICKAHGQSFEEVLKLPFSEAGMATEDCHPRYVAFLLRMGDLLDVDDNRFCPVMMRMNGSKLPSTSHTHFEKHQSIRHFRLDAERIEIKTECPTPESYEVAYEWFKWLEKEHNQQSQHWHKIVPGKKLGRLPTLSPPVVDIEKPYLIIEKGKKPGFAVDQQAVLKILRSTGLYTSKFDSVREILQNAVDSTLVAIWVKNKDLIQKLEPTNTQLLMLYEERRIKVELKRDPAQKDIFLLSVSDSGIGISEEDLKFMLHVGSSSKNKRKSKITEEMPIWYRPSGNFGIGLQSIYLLSDSFSIKTKSIFTHEALKINFSKGKEHSVIIERLPADSVDYGAIVELKVKIEEFPERISIPWGGKGRQLLEKLNEFDFTKADSNLSGYEEINILMAIHEFNQNSPVKIKSSGTALDPEKCERFFCSKTNIILSEISFPYSDFGNFSTLFRGQAFKDLVPSLMCASCLVDFYSFKAVDFLSYNREKILPQAKIKAVEDLITSLLDYIEKNFEHITENQKPCAAAFYFFYSPEEFRLKYENHLLQYKIQIHESNHLSLYEVLHEVKIGSMRSFQIKENGQIATPSQTEPTGGTILLSGGSSRTSMRLITHFATKEGLFWQESKKNSQMSTIHTFFKEDVPPFEEELIKEMIFGENHGFEIGNRALFPAWGEFRKLALKGSVRWARIFQHDGFSSEYFVLPCIFDANGSLTKYDKSKELLSWAYDNRKDHSASLIDIEALYDKFIEYLKRL